MANDLHRVWVDFVRVDGSYSLDEWQPPGDCTYGDGLYGSGLYGYGSCEVVDFGCGPPLTDWLPEPCGVAPGVRRTVACSAPVGVTNWR